MLSRNRHPNTLQDTFFQSLIHQLEPENTYATPEGILRFSRDVVGISLADYQEDCLFHFVKHKRAAIRAPHGVGKSAMAAIVVLWGMSAFPMDDVKVVTTASAWRQLTHFLWKEIHKWGTQADWAQIGLIVRRKRELLEHSFKLPNKEAFAVASSDPAFIEGAHATRMIYVFDEAKAIPDPTWDAAEGAFAGTGDDAEQDGYAMAISTPAEQNGRFYDISIQKPGYEDWWVRHITQAEAIKAGRMSISWAEQRGRQWGIESAVYKNRVLGEFSADSEELLIPPSWVEAAVERGRGVIAPTGKRGIGVDTARSGEDNTVFAEMIGRHLVRLQDYKQQRVTQVVFKLKVFAADKRVPIAVDVIGTGGAGTVDMMGDAGYKVGGVNAAGKAVYPNGKPILDSTGELTFVNMRSALWWLARMALDPNGDDPISLPDHKQLFDDLTAPLFTYTNIGKIAVESKDDMKKRLKRSPDYADAFILALWAQFAIKRGSVGGFPVLN